MKMNKEQFLKTEFGGELESTITAWDDALSRNREDKEVLRTLAWCQAQWEVYRMAIKHFYGVEYHFTRTDEYYGLCTEDESDWLMRVKRVKLFQMKTTKRIYGRNGRRFTQTFQTRTTKPMRESFLKGTGRRCWKARRFCGRRNCLIMI